MGWQVSKDPLSYSGMSMPTQERFHRGLTTLPPQRSPWSFVNPESAVVSGHLSTELTLPQQVRGLWPQDKVLRRARGRGKPPPMMGPVPGQQHGVPWDQGNSCRDSGR